MSLHCASNVCDLPSAVPAPEERGVSGTLSNTGEAVSDSLLFGVLALIGVVAGVGIWKRNVKCSRRGS